jgi:hypothetical protein
LKLFDGLFVNFECDKKYLNNKYKANQSTQEEMQLKNTYIDEFDKFKFDLEKYLKGKI